MGISRKRFGWSNRRKLKMDKINSYQQRREKSCFYPWTGLILLSVLLACSYGEKSYQSTCETIPSEIHITKDEFHKASGTTRTCEQSVAVNKCEGECASSLRPSALNANGFQKKCSCCRESSHRKRSITLTNCYDSDGGRLSGALGTMDVTVNEPMGCKCFSCS